MPRKIVAVALAAAAIAGGSVAGHSAPDKTGRYLIGATPVLSVTCCSGDVADTTGVGIGGFQFSPANALPKQIVVKDSIASGGIGYTVCQVLVEATPSPSCGDPGTVRIAGCTPPSGKIDLVGQDPGWVKNKVVATFIRMADPSCEGQASSGELVLSYR